MIRSGGRRLAREHARGGERGALWVGFRGGAVLPGQGALGLAAPRYLTEERLRAALPWHPGEFVDGRDDQRREQLVDLAVDHDYRQALAVAVAWRERALAGHVRAAQQGALAQRVDLDVVAGAQ